MSNFKDIKYIIGLGNPGPGYTTSPHNLGFIFVDMLLKQVRHVEEIRLDKQKAWKYNNIIISKPSTYMNNSGEAIKVLRKNDSRGTLEFAQSLLVVHDDIGLAMHRITYKDGAINSGLGGHNGLRDIVKKLGEMGLKMSDACSFKRIRMGCDIDSREALSDYVTKPMSVENIREWLAVIDEYLCKNMREICSG